MSLGEGRGGGWGKKGCMKGYEGGEKYDLGYPPTSITIINYTMLESSEKYAQRRRSMGRVGGGTKGREGYKRSVC